MNNKQKYINEYNKQNYKQIRIRLRNDDPVLEHLKEQESVNAYIIQLIREDMKKGN